MGLSKFGLAFKASVGAVIVDCLKDIVVKLRRFINVGPPEIAFVGLPQLQSRKLDETDGRDERDIGSTYLALFEDNLYVEWKKFYKLTDCLSEALYS